MNICCKTVSFCCKKCNSIYNKIIPFHREESYKKENGFTALIKACANGYSECRDILLAAGADTRIIDINGKNYEEHYDDFLDYGPLATRNQSGKKKTGKKWNKR